MACLPVLATRIAGDRTLGATGMQSKGGALGESGGSDQPGGASSVSEGPKRGASEGGLRGGALSGAPPAVSGRGSRQMVEVLPASKLTPQGLEYAKQRGIYRGDDLSW